MTYKTNTKDKKIFLIINFYILNTKKVKKKLSDMFRFFPAIVGSFLLIFFIAHDLILGKSQLLTKEWMYIILGLLLYTIILEQIVKYISDTVSQKSIKILTQKELKTYMNTEKANDIINITVKKFINEGGGYDIIKSIMESNINVKNTTIPNKIFNYIKENYPDEEFSWNDIKDAKEINNGKSFDRANFYTLYGKTERTTDERKYLFGNGEILVDTTKNNLYKLTDTGKKIAKKV